MWPFRPSHRHQWVSVPTTIQRGTYGNAEVLWMKDKYGKLFDALVFVADDEEPEVYVPYRYWRAGR